MSRKVQTSHTMPASPAASLTLAAFHAFADLCGRIVVSLVEARDSDKSGFYEAPAAAIKATVDGLALDGVVYCGNVTRADVETAANKVPQGAAARLAAVGLDRCAFGKAGTVPTLAVHVERKGQSASIGAPRKARTVAAPMDATNAVAAKLAALPEDKLAALLAALS